MIYMLVITCGHLLSIQTSMTTRSLDGDEGPSISSENYGGQQHKDEEMEQQKCGILVNHCSNQSKKCSLKGPNAEVGWSSG